MIDKINNYSKKKPRKHSTRRAVSEIIVTLLLTGVTVSGAVMVWAMFSGVSELVNPTELSVDDIESGKIKIVGYDTRDGANLSGIDVLDNTSDNKLCALSCTGGATEYIVLTIRNVSLDLVPIDSITVNGVSHKWDDTTAGILLGTSYPSEGKFSIIDVENGGTLTQFSATTLDADEQIRLVVNLSGEMQDIEIVDSMRVGFSSITADAKITIIASGTTR